MENLELMDKMNGIHSILSSLMPLFKYKTIIMKVNSLIYSI